MRFMDPILLHNTQLFMLLTQGIRMHSCNNHFGRSPSHAQTGAPELFKPAWIISEHVSHVPLLGLLVVLLQFIPLRDRG